MIKQKFSRETEIHDDERKKPVVWIASYPKSGNTWVQNVIRNAGRRYGIPNEDLDVYKLMREGRKPKLADCVKPEILTFPSVVLKTHSKYLLSGAIHPKLNLKTIGFVYIVRNPLDMLLSFINFTRIQYRKYKDNKEYQKKLFLDLLGFNKTISYEEWLEMTLDSIPKKNLDHALARFIELDTMIPNLNAAGGSWRDHVSSWLLARDRCPSVVLRFEDLLHGHESFTPLMEIFRFSKLEISKAAEAVNKGSQKLGKQSNNIFFNKMTSFYYQDYFSADLIRQFLQRYKKDLAAIGYVNLPGLVSE